VLHLKKNYPFLAGERCKERELVQPKLPNLAVKAITHNFRSHTPCRRDAINPQSRDNSLSAGKVIAVGRAPSTKKNSTETEVPML